MGEMQSGASTYVQRLDSTHQSASQGEDHSRLLREQMQNILKHVSDNIDQVGHHTRKLSQKMATTTKGMYELEEGTKAVVKTLTNGYNDANHNT